MTIALLLALAPGQRIHPSDEGVNLVFNPTRFAYQHEYKFENLKEDARSVYFLLPRNCQEHTITSFSYSVAGKALDYKVVSETPGWQVARAEVPPSRNFSVIMDVRGVHWNGKLSREPSKVPSDIAPPPISEDKMKWYKAPSPYFARVEPAFSERLTKFDLNTLGSSFEEAFLKVHRYMAKNLKFKDGAASPEEFLQGVGNCNGLNRAFSTIFDREATGAYVGVEMNGIVMGGGDIHAMSLVGKRLWRYLVPTDAVKLNDGNLDLLYLSGHAMGPMLLFQEGLGDPKDPKGGVVFRVEEVGRNARAPNPGGLMLAYSKQGIVGGGLNGGRKLSFTQSPVTDFDALRRELKTLHGSVR